MSDNHEDTTGTHKRSRTQGLIAYLYGRPLAMLARLAEMQARSVAEFVAARKDMKAADFYGRAGAVPRKHRSSNCYPGVENGDREVARRQGQIARGLLSPLFVEHPQ